MIKKIIPKLIHLTKMLKVHAIFQLMQSIQNQTFHRLQLIKRNLDLKFQLIHILNHL